MVLGERVTSPPKVLWPMSWELLFYWECGVVSEPGPSVRSTRRHTLAWMQRSLSWQQHLVAVSQSRRVKGRARGETCNVSAANSFFWALSVSGGGGSFLHSLASLLYSCICTRIPFFPDVEDKTHLFCTLRTRPLLLNCLPAISQPPL